MFNTIFFSSSIFGLEILKKLETISFLKISSVVTKTDKPQGRGQKTRDNPISAYCQLHQLPLIKTDVFDETFIKKYQDLKPDLVIVVAFGPPFFTQEMIDFPTFKVINIHPSPLPKYRGATPAPMQIINNEKESALTFFQLDPLPDHGPIIAQIPFAISSTQTSLSFYQKAFDLAAKNIEKVIENYLKNPKKLTIQDHLQKSYYPKLTKEFGFVDWKKSAEYNEKFIRANFDWPVAWTKVANIRNEIFKMKIFSAKIVNQNLSLEKVQIEGKNITNWSEISKYYHIVQ